MAYSYTTGDELRQWGDDLGPLRKTIVEKAAARLPQYATFLSHSSRDADILPGAIRILENHGARVYLDKKDPSLPPYTSRDTADILRKRINESKKFILLASNNSKDSRWVPWELGLADGYKNPRNAAIFPSVDKQTEIAWTEQEYLGIYDRIVFGDLNGKPKKVWMVLNQKKNTATELSDWLAA
ncbi:hypothetical protein ACFB49_20140 [Sphingomonas sp. DBB INV C78]|uniref:toll/interleukin-1 receptor domain-containing protein n=1 Tax=Sphingomonas sp. DBB INV C78 TaxID=3349434 RepID=UPI0036D28A5A